MRPLRPVLVAPLNWGLGHATRCIPIVRELLRNQVEIVLAGDGGSLDLLRKEFPQLHAEELPGYNISYPTNGKMVLHMARKVPGILKAIHQEQQWLKSYLRYNKLAGIISDNRYGLHHPEVYSVFVTHQIFIKTPLLQGVVDRLNHNYIQKFEACWVPDWAGASNLSGELSHKDELPAKVQFVGPLSRFSNRAEHDAVAYDWVGLVSGPEPQRSLFENILRKQFLKSGKKALLVCGKAHENTSLQVGNLTEVSHLTATALEATLSQAKYIVARSGYSTIMDLVALGKTALLVPTPGQTEQEYLAQFHAEKGHFLRTSQEQINLEDWETKLEATTLQNQFPKANLLTPAVTDFLQRTAP